MRMALAISAALLVCATPAVAQGKTKSAPAGAAEAVKALEVCETFARGDVLATQSATEQGWDAYEQASESPFVKSYAGGKDLAGIGPANLFSLVETYPQGIFGYCRVDVSGPTGSKGAAVVRAIATLPRYGGDVRATDAGDFASLQGIGNTGTMLLTHWTADAFVIQLTIVTPRAAPVAGGV